MSLSPAAQFIGRLRPRAGLETVRPVGRLREVRVRSWSGLPHVDKTLAQRTVIRKTQSRPPVFSDSTRSTFTGRPVSRSSNSFT